MAEISYYHPPYLARPLCRRGCGLPEHVLQDCRSAKLAYDIRYLINKAQMKRSSIRRLRRQIKAEEEQLGEIESSLYEKIYELFPPMPNPPSEIDLRPRE